MNRDAVLNKLPRRCSDQSNPDSDAETSWGSAIEEHLATLRAPEKTQKARGKRIQISAGKSISLEDLRSEENTGITEKKAKSKRRNKETTENDSAAEDDPEPSVLEMQNIKNKKCNKPLQEKGNSADGDKSAISRNILKEQNRQDKTPEKKQKLVFREKDFVLAKFTTKTDKRERMFLGKIENIYDNDYEICFLRKKETVKNTYFVYPQIPDIEILKPENIVALIELANEQRGRFTFRGIPVPLKVLN